MTPVPGSKRRPLDMRAPTRHPLSNPARGARRRGPRPAAARVAGATLLSLALAFGVAAPSLAEDSELRIANGRIPLPEGSEDPSVHFAIQSRAKETRTIVGASSPRAVSVSIRRTAVVDGQWDSVAMPDGMPIPAGGAVAFAPRGLFLRMVGAEKFKAGEKVEIVLEFANGEKLGFEAVVSDD